MLVDLFQNEQNLLLYEDDYLFAYWDRSYLTGGHIIVEWQPGVSRTERLSYGYDDLRQLILVFSQILTTDYGARRVMVFKRGVYGDQTWHIIPQFRLKTPALKAHQGDLIRESLALNQLRLRVVLLKVDYHF